MVVYEKIFGSINKSYIKLTQKYYYTIILYIRGSRATLEVFHYTLGWL